MNTLTTKHSLSLFFITLITFLPSPSHAADTLDSSQTLTDNGTTLLSSAGTFEFGFFNSSNSGGNRYLGIWYKRISAGTVVWTANRDNPLTNASGALRILQTGSLVLFNTTNGTISVWSTNTSRTVQNPVAQLLDSGNLVVRDADDVNPENYLWQSFDYPTDTFLPGMRLGVNVTSGHEVFIRSGRNSDDLASGDYTYRCDPTGFPQNVIRRGAEVVYRTGPWNGITFNGSPNLQNDSVFTFGMVINGEEVYYHYDVQNETIFSRFTISPTGVGGRWLWREQTQDWDLYLTIPIDACDSYNRCGPHSTCDTGDTPPCSCFDKFEPRDPEAWGRGDWFGGCIRSTPLNWTNGDGFLKYSLVKLPDTRNSSNNANMSPEECRVFCLNNRTCTAYASLDVRSENGCLFWYGDLDDMQETPTGQDIYIRMAASELGAKGRRRKILIATLSVVIGTLLLSAMLFLCLWRRKQRDHHQLEERDTTRLNYAANHPDDAHSKDPELPLFDLSTIVKATDGFSSKNKIGQGGFGTVYKGVLEDGLEVAVKRLSKTSHQGLDEFKNEVICIAKLQHRNLVKLLGWCIEAKEMMLVYEYMPNKSLNAKLFDPAESVLLEWPTRFNIINGVARGLMYLHQDSRLRVIHRDLKTSNILLDSDMNPKISDFGLARTFGGDESGGGTSRIVGTYGYMSPEYVVDGLFSVKSDVYSYGVVVLEIVSGKKNRGFMHRDHRLNLLGHAWMLHTEGRSTEFIDPCLVNSSINTSEALRSIHVGLLCVQENPDDRPIMSSVVMMLTNDGVLPEPRRPGFFTERQMRTHETSASSNTDTSKNIMTMTQLDAR